MIVVVVIVAAVAVVVALSLLLLLSDEDCLIRALRFFPVDGMSFVCLSVTLGGG